MEDWFSSVVLTLFSKSVKHFLITLVFYLVAATCSGLIFLKNVISLAFIFYVTAANSSFALHVHLLKLLFNQSWPLKGVFFPQMKQIILL